MGRDSFDLVGDFGKAAAHVQQTDWPEKVGLTDGWEAFPPKEASSHPCREQWLLRFSLAA